MAASGRGGAFDGFHCLASDLAKPAANCPDVPVFFRGNLEERGHLDVNPVSWHELAERGITIRGAGPTSASTQAVLSP